MQQIDAPLTRCATFLVLCIGDSQDAVQNIQNSLAGVSGLIKNVSSRDNKARFACTTGIGSDAWGRLTEHPKPKELRTLPVLKGKKHSAVSTPGDLLFHIRADRQDMCFEFERQLMESFGDAVTKADVTIGFRYFDARDLLGFVDGTANPVGADLAEATFVTAEDDASSIDGSYVVVQKYLHDLASWKKLTVEQQEAVVGRTKLENIELDDADSGQKAHKTLATIEDEHGVEHDILRDNMPFGSPASGEYGTYFIGYSRKLWVTEKMLERMFVGDPPGLHDRILDYSKPVTGTTFFAPSAQFLNGLAS
ncbi:hypothetical protein M409DRAFT_24921 [Zasmidium cellare ATCC 36951]|uniref:Dyp-type peroxidase n=1 Tax=Zasmidium cellare ATCC 36951 TaxID=1080233 RepID=A0A6A6CDA1_ZASCE|nr:uncharacterized protein M409DRAFT_24921 [Zasmidium cellare ATCC 36951]KAF2165021.1 hypothetical protein M409DRAFT_24921 [Zasmidium cellare ATCC 36951]